MKKVFTATVLSLIVSVLLASCGNNGLTNKTTTPEQTTTTTTAETTTKAEDQQTTTTPESTKASEESTTTSAEASGGTTDGIRPEFKEALDSYEEFFDEYCEFMKKYMASDGTDLTLIMDYATYMTKYTETMNSMDVLDDGEMSAEESQYYLEVTTRINKKLLEVSITA